MKVTKNKIQKILGFKLSEYSKKQIESSDLEYSNIDQPEYESYINRFINVLTDDIIKSGEHRIDDWENGWSENLESFSKTGNVDDLIPKYHSKNTLVRWNRRIVKPYSANFDYKLHIIMVDAIAQHYFKNVSNIFEFGCGPGYHLLRMNAYFPKKSLTGCDWTVASQDTITNINQICNKTINCHNFNFFSPDYGVVLPSNTGIYTVAALEQVGSNYRDFVDYLLANNPKICIHMEPIDELLDSSNLLDNLTIKYFRKRNYLNKFLPYLEQLELEGRIEILNKQRILSGSYFIEGHSLIVWKPL